MGQYQFNGSVLSGLLGGGAAVPLASFLLGYPDLTTIATVINPNTDSRAGAYALYGQDDFKLSQSLTINYGLRWEYHPGFHDINGNTVNFDPYYQNIVNGRNTGAVIATNQAALTTNLNPGFVAVNRPNSDHPGITSRRRSIRSQRLSFGFCAPHRFCVARFQQQ